MNHKTGGLLQDLTRIFFISVDRRQSIRLLLSGVAALQGCTRNSGQMIGSASSSGTPATARTRQVGCAIIPEETSGPFPADGAAGPGPGYGPPGPPRGDNSHGMPRGVHPPGPPPGGGMHPRGGKLPNALVQAGIVRRDIRPSLPGTAGLARGTPLTIRLRIVNVNTGCASATGAAVYLWHCNRDGNYSMYSDGIDKETYLRGVQVADKNGYVEFTSIFPGCYDGRMPHVHFEVFPTLTKASLASNRIKTSQFTFPDGVLHDAYQAPGYATSIKNLANISIATDNVFSDGVALQTATVTGSVSQGYVATLNIGVAL